MYFLKGSVQAPDLALTEVKRSCTWFSLIMYLQWNTLWSRNWHNESNAWRCVRNGTSAATSRSQQKVRTKRHCHRWDLNLRPLHLTTRPSPTPKTESTIPQAIGHIIFILTLATQLLHNKQCGLWPVRDSNREPCQSLTKPAIHCSSSGLAPVTEQ
jgi:hypothetical protein